MESIVKRGKLKKINKMIDIHFLLKTINAIDKDFNKPAGDELWSTCPHPDHDSSSLSWSININPENTDKFGLHNCYSCGFKGNYVNLTAVLLSHSIGKQVTNEQALEFITDLFSLDQMDEDTIYDLVLEERRELKQAKHKTEEGLTAKELPDEFELVTPDDKRYYNYLTKPISKGGRGLTDEVINKYHLGFCRDGLYHHRIVIPFKQEGELVSFLARSILKPIDTIKKDGKMFVICPECKKRNKYNMKECIKCDHDLTKYVPKKARARYPKGSTMEYMMWPYDELNQELDYVILVEGAMDAMRMEVLGYKNVMCLFGNKVSDYHVKLLKKYENKIGKKLRIFLFPDADDGGDILIEFANAKLKYEFQTWVIELPRDEDNPLDPGSATPKQIRIAVNKRRKIHTVYAEKFGIN